MDQQGRSYSYPDDFAHFLQLLNSLLCQLKIKMRNKIVLNL